MSSSLASQGQRQDDPKKQPQSRKTRCGVRAQLARGLANGHLSDPATTIIGVGRAEPIYRPHRFCTTFSHLSRFLFRAPKTIFVFLLRQKRFCAFWNLVVISAQISDACLGEALRNHTTTHLLSLPNHLFSVLAGCRPLQDLLWGTPLFEHDSRARIWKNLAEATYQQWYWERGDSMPSPVRPRCHSAKCKSLQEREFEFLQQEVSETPISASSLPSSSMRDWVRSILTRDFVWG